MKFVSLIALFLSLTVYTTNNAQAKELQFDSNVAASLKAQILADLQFMGSITSNSATPLHQKIFGAVGGPNYSGWFTSRVFKVGVSDCGSAMAVACVIPMYANKIWMTKNYTQFDHPQIARLSVIYHEARHTERNNGNWPHATCPTPFKNEQGQDMHSIWTGSLLQGQPACDITPYGSYGSQTILLRNIATQCTNCTDKVKADANLYAMDQLGRITNAQAKTAMKQDFGIPARRF
ncbi:MAG: hypothetical protein JST80_04700 [Bdellovibrionales bacterium]|nr:hypothetical protein [Bdellovibrionales bacterium]